MLCNNDMNGLVLKCNPGKWFKPTAVKSFFKSEDLSKTGKSQSEEHQLTDLD